MNQEHVKQAQVKQPGDRIGAYVKTIQFAGALVAAVLAGCASRTESLYSTTRPPR